MSDATGSTSTLQSLDAFLSCGNSFEPQSATVRAGAHNQQVALKQPDSPARIAPIGVPKQLEPKRAHELPSPAFSTNRLQLVPSHSPIRPAKRKRAHSHHSSTSSKFENKLTKEGGQIIETKKRVRVGKSETILPHEMVVWSHQRLIHERAIALSCSVDPSTRKSYGPALHSYLDFVCSHKIPPEPTPDTLSLFVTYMSHYMNPRSVDSYLSRICQQLEMHFPDIRQNCRSPLVQCTLKGCRRMYDIAINRKNALTLEDLGLVVNHYRDSSNHDDLLFVAMLLTGFFALLRLGELTDPDDPSMRDYQRAIGRLTVAVHRDAFEFELPAHKAAKYVESNHVIIRQSNHLCDPRRHFIQYIRSRDKLFPFSSPLWLTSAGVVPTRRFFVRRLRELFKSNIGGHSMRAGGAAHLAEQGVSPHRIQAIGRWSSSAFQTYIRKHPVIIEGSIHGRRSILI